MSEDSTATKTFSLNVPKGVTLEAAPFRFANTFTIDVALPLYVLPETLKNFPTANLYPKTILMTMGKIKRSLLLETSRSVLDREYQFIEDPENRPELVEIREEDPNIGMLPLAWHWLLGYEGTVFSNQSWIVNRSGEQRVYRVYYFHSLDSYSSRVICKGSSGLLENFLFWYGRR